LYKIHRIYHINTQ